MTLQLIGASNFGTGTTMYQGDNRFRLQDVMFFQHRLELRSDDKWFIRTYYTHEDAGDSYDAVFTGFRMQEYAKDDNTWFRDYRNRWNSLGYSSQVFKSPGFPHPVFDPGPPPTFVIDQDAIDQWYLDNNALLTDLHGNVRAYANSDATTVGTVTDAHDRLIPGTEEFDRVFADITSRFFSDGGTRFYDRSALWHSQAERRFALGKATVTAGASFRQYLPEFSRQHFLRHGNGDHSQP